MVLTLLRFCIAILGLMTLTYVSRHRFVRIKTNCKLRVLDSCPLFYKRCMVAPYIKKIIHSMICLILVHSRDITGMFFVDKVSWLVENLNIGIYSDIINAINFKLREMVLLIELYQFIPLSVTFTIVQGHGILTKSTGKSGCDTGQ